MGFNADKFNQLVHYIIWKTDDAAKLGSTKLNKILWFSDARAFVLHGQPITGEKYIRRQHGPMARHFSAAWRQLEREGEIRHWRDKLYDHEKDVFRASRRPNMKGFTKEELQIVDYFQEYITEEHTATSISDESHDYGWEIARMGEELPYYAILADRIRDPEGDELEWARSVVKRLSLP